MGTNKISGAEAVIRCLLEEGVDLVYGYPGGAMPVYDELYKFKDQLHHVLEYAMSKALHMQRRICKSYWKESGCSDCDWSRSYKLGNRNCRCAN
jgi:acetolactate synthase-1/2/3 large subunit